MSEEWLNTIVILIGLGAAASFVIGLHFMNSPATARQGNRISAVGMAVARPGSASAGEGMERDFRFSVNIEHTSLAASRQARNF